MQLIMWDWKEQPPWAEINAALEKEPVKRVARVPDTGCDTCAAVVGARTAQQAQNEWNRHVKEMS